MVVLVLSITICGMSVNRVNIYSSVAKLKPEPGAAEPPCFGGSGAGAVIFVKNGSGSGLAKMIFNGLFLFNKLKI